MPIYKMSSIDRRKQKLRRIETWVKWVAVLLSVTALAITLALVHARRDLVGGTTASPATVEIGQPVTAR